MIRRIVTILPSNYLRKEFMPEKVPFSKEDIPQYIFNFTTNIPWNKMYRRSLIADNDLKFEHRQRANDVVFVMQALYLAKRITVVDERLIDYRYNNANNLTSGLSKESFTARTMHFWQHIIFLKERGAFENEKVKQSFDNKTLIFWFRVSIFRQTKHLQENCLICCFRRDSGRLESKTMRTIIIPERYIRRTVRC